MPDDLSGFVEEFEEALTGKCRHCGRVHDEAENAVGGCPLRPLSDPSDKPTRRRTLRCVVFGCVPKPELHGTGDVVHRERDESGGRCVRCQRFIIPRARALKGSR